MIPAAMKRLSLLLAGCFIAVETFGAAPRPTPCDLRTLSDSLFHWRAAHPADSLADNLSGWWTDERGGAVYGSRCCGPTPQPGATSAAA